MAGSSSRSATTGNSRGYAACLAWRRSRVDPRFATNPGRVTNRVDLERELRAKTRNGSATTFSPRWNAAVVPAGPINTIGDLFADPQFKARGMLIEPQGIPGVRSPIVMSESPLVLERRSPKLGEHQAEILREIGLE